MIRLQLSATGPSGDFPQATDIHFALLVAMIAASAVVIAVKKHTEELQTVQAALPLPADGPLTTSSVTLRSDAQ